MKKFLVLVFALFLGTSSIFAQVSVDPNENFYTLVESWELRGLISDVPPLRPFPLSVIRDILQTVIEKGNERDVNNAQMYWEKVTGKPWNASLETGVTYKKDINESGFGEALIGLYPDVNGDITLFDNFVSIGYHLGMAVYNHSVSDYLPVYENDLHDGLTDSANLGPFEAFWDMNDVLALGTKNIFVQTGIYRSGYGPFLGAGLALNDNSYHKTNFSFTTIHPKWSYTQQYSTIGATTSYDGTDQAPDKYIAFHALEFKPFPFISFAYYETIIFGKRLDPSYLMPVPYYIAQGIGGYNDNLQMGILLKVRPVKSLLWATDLFVDDVSANELVKLNFDTKLRLAAKTGFIYTPENSYCTRMGLDYMMITPFTYSHWEYDDLNVSAAISPGCFNFQNYTNNGIPMGSSYPPNSDRICLVIDFLPIPPLHIRVQSSFLRHANICESYTDDEALSLLLGRAGQYATDGSIYTHANLEDPNSKLGTHIDTAWDHLNFLNQDHKMYVLQEGLDVEYAFKKMKWGQVTLKFSYLFEWIKNPGVSNHLYPGGLVSESGGVYTYKGSSYSSAEDLVEAARQDWIDGIGSDQINNFFTLGLRYQF